MKRIAISFAVVAVFVLLPALLSAAEPMQEDPHWFESPRNWSAGFNVGMIFPTNHNIQDVYGTKGAAVYCLQAGWRIVQELELHAEGAYTFYEGSGISVAENDKVERTKEKFKMHIAPAELGLIYRFNFVLDQPVVPFGGANAVYTYWMEEKLDSSLKNRGLLYGYSLHGGVMFLLDKIDKKSSGKLESEWGINNTYLFYEYKYMSIDNLGDKKSETIDLSANVHTLGVMFQF